MKIQGNVYLALGFLLMLSLATAALVKSLPYPISCLLCKSNNPKYGCQPEDTCFSSRYCFLQTKYIRGKGVMKINQGCTQACREYIHATGNKVVHVWCCRTKMCNRHMNSEED